MSFFKNSFLTFASTDCSKSIASCDDLEDWNGGGGGGGGRCGEWHERKAQEEGIYVYL